MNFYNWLIYKKVKRKSYISLFISYIKDYIMIKFNKKYLTAINEIKIYCKNTEKVKYPDILYLYDYKKIKIRNNNQINQI